MNPLPGSEPYENERVMRVRQAFAGMRLIEFLCHHHPPTPRDRWHAWLSVGDITLGSTAVDAERIVMAGERYIHTMHDVVEPDVNADFKIVYEDDSILVVDKPAPLPVHPSGRFNRNTLSKMTQSMYPDEVLRIAHRLDANTTGLVVFCRTPAAAAYVQPQFESRQVKKEYIARVMGHVPWDHHRCELPIGSAAELTSSRDTQGARVTHPQGQPAETVFKIESRFADSTTLLRAIPITGRTNQIRVHLWSLGFPILGDPLYLACRKLGTQQTLCVGQRPMCLHATKLSFMHPSTAREVVFETDPPAWTMEFKGD